MGGAGIYRRWTGVVLRCRPIPALPVWSRCLARCHKGCDMSLFLELSKPITVGGKPVNALTLRDVSAADVLDTGLPMLIVSMEEDAMKGFELRPKVLAALISRLANIPIDAVRQMSLNDLGRCQKYIHGFLF